jgi:hypothetical protein
MDALANPGAVMVATYWPIGRYSMRYEPASFVVADVSTLVLRLRATTWAPVTTAPLGSVTVPVMEAVTDCALAKDRLNRSATAAPIDLRS